MGGTGSVNTSAVSDEATISGTLKTGNTTFTSTQIVTVTGDLRLVSGTVLTIEGTLNIPENVSVTIEDGAKLIISGQVEVTLTVAKRAQQEAERLVTYAKNGDLHNRRLAASFVRPEGFVDPKTNKDALQKLFDVYGPKYRNRNGGYTRILKTFNRRGDNAPMAILAFVD